MKKSYHFNTYHTATRYHLARALKRQGWEKSDDPNALFSEKNLSLNDEYSKYFEYKNLLSNLLQAANVDFFPLTYSINDQNYDYVLSQITLKHHLINHVYQPKVQDLIWILKPATLNNGDEIKLFDNIDHLKKHFRTSKRLGGEHVIQRYVENPMLYKNRKFTYRIIAVFTNFSGIHLYKEGYANVSAYPYQKDDVLTNRKIHVTNYVLDGVLSGIEQKLANEIPDFDIVYAQALKIVKQCAKLLLKKYPAYLKPSSKNVIEFFGFDFILDDKKKLWLLEINQTPDCPIDDEHEFMHSLWYPYWERIVNHFVFPAVAMEGGANKGDYFTSVLEKKACYSKWCDFWHQIRK